MAGLVDISTWTHTVAEPELAAYLGEDLAAGCGENEARAAISAIGPPIELADIDPPPQDVEEILTGTLFHKGVILGTADSPANIVEFELDPMEPISVTVH